MSYCNTCGKKRKKEQNKKWKEENEEKRKEYAKNYEEENKEERRQKTQKWREDNPDKVVDYNRAYKSLKKEVDKGCSRDKPKLLQKKLKIRKITPTDEEIEMMYDAVGIFAYQKNIDKESLIADGYIYLLEALYDFDKTKGNKKSFIFRVIKNKLSELWSKNYTYKKDKETKLKHHDLSLNSQQDNEDYNLIDIFTAKNEEDNNIDIKDEHEFYLKKFKKAYGDKTYTKSQIGPILYFTIFYQYYVERRGLTELANIYKITKKSMDNLLERVKIVFEEVAKEIREEEDIKKRDHKHNPKVYVREYYRRHIKKY